MSKFYIITILLCYSNLISTQDSNLATGDFDYLIQDCVIGAERQIGDQDTMKNGDACDSYWWDRYERPYSQVSSSGDVPDYYSYVDIVQCGCTDPGDGWIYCMIELFNGEDTDDGDPLGDPGGPLSGQWYLFELDTDCDLDGDFALAVKDPTTDDHKNGWTSKQTELHKDTDGDVGRPHLDLASPCFGDPSGCEPLHPDCPGNYCGSGGNQCSNITGYETEIAKENSNIAVSRVLQNQNFPIVQLAVKKSQLGTISCDISYRAWAIRPFSPLQEMALHDKYLYGDFGSAHPDSCQYPIQNYYESDNCSGTEGFFGYHPPVAVDDIISATGYALIIPVALNDSDPDGNLDTLSANVDDPSLMDPLHGTVDENGDGTLTYTPLLPGFMIVDSFEYTICDDGLPNEPLCVKAMVYISVNQVLPVELVNFNLKKQQCDVVINWRTESEINNSHFELQFSKDGNNWSFLKRIDARGDWDKPSEYAYEHSGVQGKLYYRLIQFDQDGSKTNYGIRFIQMDCKSNYMNVFPNPLRGDIINIDLGSSNSGKGQINIYNVYGKEVKSVNTPLIIGSWKISITIDNLPKGMYFISNSWGQQNVLVPLVRI